MLNRFEVEAMLGLRLEETKVYQEANADGRLEEAKALVLRQLSKRLGSLSLPIKSQLQSLSLAQTEDLGEALLDFSTPDDLRNWLQKCQS